MGSIAGGQEKCSRTNSFTIRIIQGTSTLAGTSMDLPQFLHLRVELKANPPSMCSGVVRRYVWMSARVMA